MPLGVASPRRCRPGGDIRATCARQNASDDAPCAAAILAYRGSPQIQDPGPRWRKKWLPVAEARSRTLAL